MALADKTCVPCKGGVPALKGEALKALQAQLPGWDVVAEHHLHKVFPLPGF